MASSEATNGKVGGVTDKQIVVDVSHWNGSPNWTALAKAGVVAAWLKCTNGAYQTDDTYKRNFDNAHAAGIKVGSYHFLLSSQDPDAQAENFLHTLEWNQDLLPALDCEWDLKMKRDQWLDVTQKNRIAMIGRYVAHIKKALNVTPIIYTATSWWRPMIGDAKGYQDVKFADCPLWIAAYKSKPTPLPSQWSSHAIWQYSGSGKVNGINGTVDLDRLNVPIESLLMPPKAISA